MVSIKEIQVAEEKEEVGSLSGSSSSDIPSSRVPQVLTRSVIPSLVTGLDASDVLECYYLTRKTVLHGLANNTIEITKAALGLRHKAQKQTTAASSHTRGKKRVLALTLEYGPSRAASNLQHESLPHVIWDDEVASSVEWENEAKVYYTTEISSEEYPTANYLASVSGAALSSLLTAAVEYIESNPRHRHYQPFSIVVEQQGENERSKQTRLAHGSSDVDFMISLYQHLADLGVSLQPVLLPAHHQVRLHAVGWDQVQMGNDVPAATIANFYADLWKCVNAIATKDYRYFTPTASPSLEPTSMSLSGAPYAGADNEPTSASSQSPNPAPNSRNRNHREERNLGDLENGQENLGVTDNSLVNTSLDDAESTSDGFGNISSSYPSMAPTTIAPKPIPVGPVPAAEDAQKEAAAAAEQAYQAATQAHEAGNEQAAEAAQAAATAAQHAADMTANQQAVINSEALLSGDGNAMASAVARCFSDPLYGVTKILQNNETQTKQLTTAYLYWDGSFYLRLNLTAPFISVVPLNLELPQPDSHNGFARGDLVDWALVLAIFSFFLLGVLLTLQQIMGRNLRVIRPLYKFQRWFFDPLNHVPSNSDGDLDLSERSVVQDYMFGEERIPISMGGKLAPFSLSQMLSPDPSVEWGEGRAESAGEVEMAVRSDNGGDASNSLDDPEDDDDYSNSLLDPGAAKRLFRDPDLVDLPDLKSRSKIAVPVSFPSSPSSLDGTDSGGIT